MAPVKGRPQRPHYTQPLRDDTRWQDHAACAEANPRIFFDPARYAYALAFCHDCPVQTPCGELGDGSDGVWGNRVNKRRRYHSQCGDETIGNAEKQGRPR